MLVAENPLSPGSSFCNREDICSIAPSPKSLYGNFPTRNVRCRNKEIAVPCSLMRLHDTGYVGSLLL